MIFKKIADVLCHHEEDQLEREFVSGSNLTIGRIGLPGKNHLEWPSPSDGTESGIRVFVSGPLLEGEDNRPIRSMPERAALRHWRGFFAAVLTDPDRGKTLLVVDRRASEPISYVRVGDQLLFAPEVKDLLADPLVKREIDLQALGTFLAQGCLLADQTLFRTVRRLRGELLRIENGKVVKESYWRFAAGLPPVSASQAELERELGRLLIAAARKHMGEPEKNDHIFVGRGGFAGNSRRGLGKC